MFAKDCFNVTRKWTPNQAYRTYLQQCKEITDLQKRNKKLKTKQLDTLALAHKWMNKALQLTKHVWFIYFQVWVREGTCRCRGMGRHVSGALGTGLK